MNAFHWRPGATPLDLLRDVQRKGQTPSAACWSAACLEMTARDAESDARAIAASASAELLERLAANVSRYRLRAAALLDRAPELQALRLKGRAA